MKWWKANNKERHYQHNRRATLKLRDENPKQYILKGARRRAKEAGLEFSIGPDDFELPTHCPLLGIPLEFGRGHQADNSYSLDRINSSKGYVKGNVQILSGLANRMKSNADRETLVRFAEAILARYK